jgi:hypothetical protein
MLLSENALLVIDMQQGLFRGLLPTLLRHRSVEYPSAD